MVLQIRVMLSRVTVMVYLEGGEEGGEVVHEEAAQPWVCVCV
jgi:hypothetical protein